MEEIKEGKEETKTESKEENKNKTDEEENKPESTKEEKDFSNIKISEFKEINEDSKYDSNKKQIGDSLLEQESTPAIKGEENTFNSSFKKDIEGFVDILKTKEKKDDVNNSEEEEDQKEIKPFNPNEESNSSSNIGSEEEKSHSEDDEIFDENLIDEALAEITYFDAEETSGLGVNNLLNEINKLHNIGPKQKKGIVLIQKRLEKHIRNFNKTFYEKVLPDLTKKVRAVMEEKFKSYINIAESYEQQIAEAEDNPEAATIIEGLNDELMNEADKNDDEFNGKVEKIESDFKTKGFKENPEFLLLEEEFRVDMCSQIIDLLS